MATEAAVSAIRKRIKVAEIGANVVVRPYNIEELGVFTAKMQKSEFDAYVWLYDQCAQDFKDAPDTTKFSVAFHLDKVSGKNVPCRLITEHELSDEAAEAFVRIGDPTATCVRYGDQDFLFRTALAGTVDTYAREKLKRPLDLSINRNLLKKLKFFGDLETVERDTPYGVIALSDVVVERGGVSLEAEVGEV